MNIYLFLFSRSTHASCLGGNIHRRWMMMQEMKHPRKSPFAHLSVRKAPSDKGLEAYKFLTSSPRLWWGKLFWKYYLSTLLRTETEHLLSHGPLRRGYIRELKTHTSIAASQSNWCTNFLLLHRQMQLKNLTYTWAIIQRKVEIDQGASS